MSGQAKVLLFDLPGTAKEGCWSLNIWRTRYLLNFKKIPHTTQWVEYPDIKPTFTKLGVPSSGTNLWGGDAYTCPSIQYFPADGSKPVYVTDSWKIAAFLEEKQPDPPALPAEYGTFDVYTDLGNKLREALFLPLFPALIRTSHAKLNEASKDYFRETREAVFKQKIEELCSDEASRKQALDTAKKQLDEFLKGFPNANGEKGPFLYGEEVTYLDMVLASVFAWTKAVAEEELWVPVTKWDGGRWKRLLEVFDERGYSKVH